MCLEITNKYSTKMKEEEKKKGQKLSNEDLENVNGGGGRGKRKFEP